MKSTVSAVIKCILEYIDMDEPKKKMLYKENVTKSFSQSLHFKFIYEKVT